MDHKRLSEGNHQNLNNIFQRHSTTNNQLESQNMNLHMNHQNMMYRSRDSPLVNEYSLQEHQNCSNLNQYTPNSPTSQNMSIPNDSDGIKKSPRNWSPSNLSNYIRTSSPQERKIDPNKESILLATSQVMNLCDVPLKRKVYEDLMQEQTEPKLGFQEFMKIDQSPVFYPLEKQILDEVEVACNLLRSPYEKIVSETTHLEDAVQVTEAAICRLIKMSNQLTSFNRLGQEDRISLLKHSIIEMFCIRATTNFNSENNFWYFIDDKKKGLHLVSMEVLNAAQINYLSHKEFAIKFNSQFRNDNMIADLLTIIILFRPSRAIVSNPQAIREEFLNYCYLLRRYLQVKYNGESCMAKNSYLALMYRLEELYPLAEDVTRIYLDLNPQNAGQLFVELFDLKQ